MNDCTLRLKEYKKSSSKYRTTARFKRGSCTLEMNKEIDLYIFYRTLFFIYCLLYMNIIFYAVKYEIFFIIIKKIHNIMILCYKHHYYQIDLFVERKAHIRPLESSFAACTRVDSGVILNGY